MIKKNFKYCFIHLFESGVINIYHCNKKILTILITVILLILTNFSIVHSELTNTKISQAEQIIGLDFYNEKQNKLYFEYGRKTGIENYGLYQLIVKFALNKIEKNNKLYYINEINNIKYTLKKYSPFYLEEIRGLSQGLNIDIDKLVKVQIYLASLLKNECTTTLSTGSATLHNETFLTQNYDTKYYDFINPIIRLFFTRIYHKNAIADGYDYIYLGIPILYEIPLMNEKGLGFGGNGIALSDDRPIDEGDGIPTYLLERITLMCCSNATEVADLWANTERASKKNRNWPNHWDYATPVWCDREGGILLIEQTHNYLINLFRDSTNITQGPNDILWHANLHQYLNQNDTGSKFPDEYPSSNLREKRAKELLELNYGKITLETCKQITRDHGGGFIKNKKDSGDICRHPDSNDPHVTSFSWIIQPKKLTIYWTRSSPCSLIRGIYKKYNLTKELDKENPNTEIHFNGSLGNNNWFVSNVYMELKSYDELSGVKKIFYELNNNPWKKYSKPVNFNEDGVNIIKYYAVDKAGNKEKLKIEKLSIDKTPPSIELNKKIIGLYRYKFIAIVKDTTSKIEKVEFYLDDIYQNTVYEKPYEWIWQGYGNYTVTSIVYDYAGNSAKVNKVVNIKYESSFLKKLIIK